MKFKEGDIIRLPEKREVLFEKHNKLVAAKAILYYNLNLCKIKTKDVSKNSFYFVKDDKILFELYKFETSFKGLNEKLLDNFWIRIELYKEIEKEIHLKSKEEGFNFHHTVSLIENELNKLISLKNIQIVLVRDNFKYVAL